jgi:hypothetical protein
VTGQQPVRQDPGWPGSGCTRAPGGG